VDDSVGVGLSVGVIAGVTKTTGVAVTCGAGFVVQAASQIVTSNKISLNLIESSVFREPGIIK
jgi:hypothetical protein